MPSLTRRNLKSAILNLAINARDAMPRGGHLKIETSLVKLGGGLMPNIPAAKAGPYVLVCVSDSGDGMEPDVLAQVFQPFFTTKEQDRGSGLGLAMVQGFVTQSGGYVWIDSQVGRGTAVHVPSVPAVCGSGCKAGGCRTVSNV